MNKFSNLRSPICIICEGYEEVEYINKLILLNVFSTRYKIKTINAKSMGNIMNQYTDKMLSEAYYKVLIFCDTDKSPYIKYNEIKQKVNEFHDLDVADSIVIFGNPCTMQIVLSHFTEIKLTSNSKSINAEYIR